MREIIKRPVAMKSNLQDVIFQPETLDMDFAYAGKSTPACDEPYARLNLRALVEYYNAARIKQVQTERNESIATGPLNTDFFQYVEFFYIGGASVDFGRYWK